MDITLRPYQLKSSEFLQKRSAGLFLDVGLGKTFIFLHASKELQAKRVLIIAPKSLLLQWRNELDKIYPSTKRIILTGTRPEREKILSNYKSGYLITNYELMRLHYKELSVMNWDIICCDEATRLNARTKTYKALLRIPAPYHYPLTASPIANSPIDCYGIFNWIKPGLFPNFWFFQLDYCVKGPFNNIVGYRNLDRLAKIIAPYYIRFTAKEVAPELPDKIITDIPVELSEEERKLYTQLKKEIYQELTGGRANKISLASLGNVLVNMLRLEECVSHPSLIGSDFKVSSKIEALKEKVQEIVESGEKVLVFTKFKRVADIIYKALSDFNPLLMDGSTPGEVRQEYIDKINQDNKYQVLISTNVLAEGANVQGANHVIFFNHDFSLSKFIQKVGRIWRLNQKKTCFIWRLVGVKTIDEHMIRISERKQSLSDKLLSVKDIEEILK